MARRGKIGHKRKRNSWNKGGKVVSDDSDEDYKVDENEEFDDSNEDYCSSPAESWENVGDFEEDEEWTEEIKKARRPRKRKDSQGGKKTVLVKPIQKRVCSKYFSASKGMKNRIPEEEEEKYACNAYSSRVEMNVLADKRPIKKSRVNKRRKYGLACNMNAREKDYDDDTDDEEFIPYEDKEAISNEPKKKRATRKNRSTSGKPFKHRRKATVKRKKKSFGSWDSNGSSDSDFEISSSSDDEYAISVEEEELIREDNEVCRRLALSRRSYTMVEEVSPLRRKHPYNKGKQKIVDMKMQVGKQVCGICLSEEGKRTAVGVLNCCTHYFCFRCIMEWSKVESRCPLCKQRFETIKRTLRSDGISNARDAVFSVPERDQVYQPSEEELMGYVDLYENVLCTECHQGGDDALMLLCDLCDSPTHTYCVGLGRQVPEGNWYCHDCRPTALATENRTSNQNHTSIGSPPANAASQSSDLNEEYAPETPQSPSSPRNSGPQIQATSPAFGRTLFNRRRMHRHIYQLRNYGTRLIGTAVSGPRINLLGSLISGASTSPQA